MGLTDHVWIITANTFHHFYYFTNCLAVIIQLNNRVTIILMISNKQPIPIRVLTLMSGFPYFHLAGRPSSHP